MGISSLTLMVSLMGEVVTLESAVDHELLFVPVVLDVLGIEGAAYVLVHFVGPGTGRLLLGSEHDVSIPVLADKSCSQVCRVRWMRSDNGSTRAIRIREAWVRKKSQSL